MKKVVLFVRVSTQQQELESQIEALKRTAYADGYDDDKIIIIAKKESGVKLKEAEREGLKELKSVIQEQDIDCVYIFELSRLSRDPMVLYSVRENVFMQNKVQLKCLKPSFSLLEEPERLKYDTMGSLVFSIFGCFAEQEIVEKKERFHRGKKQKAIEGKYAGGILPYGYEIDRSQGNLIVINPEEAAIIHSIYDMYEAGYSQPKIAQELHERGVKYDGFVANHRGPGRNFDISFINQLLTNELLTGRKLKSVNGAFERSYPPIISEEQFERCRKLASERSTFFGKTPNLYLAKGLLTCPECGSNFVAQPAKVTYHCYNANMATSFRKYNHLENHYICSNKACISISAMDSLLWYITVNKECEYLLSVAKDDKIAYEEKIKEYTEKINAIEPRLSDIEAKRSRVIESYIEGEITKDMKIQKYADLDEQKMVIFKQKVEYEKKIEWYNSRLDDMKRLYSLEALDVDEIADDIYSVMQLREDISKIDSDDERIRLVRKHIKHVSFEKRTITYKFNDTKIRPAETKHLKVEFIDGSTRYYIFLCNDGRGGHWINSDENCNVLDDINIKIERRLIDRTKIVQRNKHRNRKKKAFDSQYGDGKLYLLGYEQMAEYLCVSRQTIARHCQAGFFDEALSNFDKKTHILDAEKAIELMRASDAWWFKAALKKFDEKHKEE